MRQIPRKTVTQPLLGKLRMKHSDLSGPAASVTYIRVAF